MLQHTKRCWTIPCSNFVGTVWGWPLPVPTWLCTSAQSKVHKDMDERVWCGWTWLACTESWPQPDRTSLGWIRVETESQAFLSTIRLWPHKCTSGRMVKKIPLNAPKPLPRRVIAAKGGPTSCYGLRVGCHLNSYVSQGRWVNTFGDIVYTINDMFKWNEGILSFECHVCLCQIV